MKNLLSKGLLLFFFIIGCTVSFAQLWPRVGNQFGTIPSAAGNTDVNFYSPSLAYNPAREDELYTAYVDDSKELVVEKYGEIPKVPSGTVIPSGSPGSQIPPRPLPGTTPRPVIPQLVQKGWSKVGVITASVDYTSPSLAFSQVSYQPYVAYIDNVAHKYVVIRYDGTSWLRVGTIPETAGDHYLPTLVFKPHTDEAFIAFIDSTNANNVVVRKFDGTSWIAVGGTIGQATNALLNYTAAPFGYILHHSCSMAFQPSTKKPYIAYINSANYLAVEYLSGNTNWVSAVSNTANNNIVAASLTTSALAINPKTNFPYIAFLDNNRKVRVVRESINRGGSGSHWTDVRSDSIKDGNVPPPLAFNTRTFEPCIGNWEPRLATFTVQKFNGTTWELLGINTCQGLPMSPLNFKKIGPECGYDLIFQSPNILFYPSTRKFYIAYVNEIYGRAYEVRMEP